MKPPARCSRRIRLQVPYIERRSYHYTVLNQQRHEIVLERDPPVLTGKQIPRHESAECELSGQECEEKAPKMTRHMTAVDKRAQQVDAGSIYDPMSHGCVGYVENSHNRIDQLNYFSVATIKWYDNSLSDILAYFTP